MNVVFSAADLMDEDVMFCTDGCKIGPEIGFRFFGNEFASSFGAENNMKPGYGERSGTFVLGLWRNILIPKHVNRSLDP